MQAYIFLRILLFLLFCSNIFHQKKQDPLLYPEYLYRYIPIFLVILLIRSVLFVLVLEAFLIALYFPKQNFLSLKFLSHDKDDLMNHKQSKEYFLEDALEAWLIANPTLVLKNFPFHFYDFQATLLFFHHLALN